MPSVALLTPGWNPWAVIGSVLLAGMAAHVALDLARRIHQAGDNTARIWWAGGSLVLGTGIWSMHFLGMEAMRLPIELGYEAARTLLSWLAGVAASGVALGVATRRDLTRPTLLLAALAMTAGICAMHYIGMAALQMQPGITWDMRWVAASVGVAFISSTAALTLFVWTMRRAGTPPGWQRSGAAALMALGIAGLHYTGMAAAGFVDGSLCLSRNDLGGDSLGLIVAMAATLMLALTLMTTALDTRLRGRASGLENSLEAAADELRRIALLDPLTGLPNRLTFEDTLRQAALRAGDTGQRVAVLLIDLDGFKLVNSSLGHRGGDEALQLVATRLHQACRPDDLLARGGGDEFLVCLDWPADEADEALLALAQRLVGAVRAQATLAGGQDIRLSCSIGVALFPEHGPVERLVSAASTAMHEAKRSGRGQARLYAPHMADTLRDQMALTRDLHDAIAAGALELWYQPKVHAHHGRINGCEALVRWRHPERGLIGPNLFIPLAERHGLICPLGDWITDAACRQVRTWLDQGLRMRVAINLSVHQLRQPDLIERIRASLAAHRVPPELITVEITESVAMEDVRQTLGIFTALRALGVKIAIDDFGTGYSSLSYLGRLPVQQLKIDRSFIMELDREGHGRTIVDAVIRLGHALGLETVAEGVETPAQRDLLTALGCDKLQGYLFAKPMPAAALTRWLIGIERPASIDFSDSVYPTAVPHGTEPPQQPVLP